jgi:hypothetical protein
MQFCGGNEAKRVGELSGEFGQNWAKTTKFDFDRGGFG